MKQHGLQHLPSQHAPRDAVYLPAANRIAASAVDSHRWDETDADPERAERAAAGRTTPRRVRAR